MLSHRHSTIQFIFLVIVCWILPGCAANRFDPYQIEPTQPGAIIIDHRCTKIDQIPDYWIEKARETFVVYYGHTSHGSQIVSGMNALMANDSRFLFGGVDRDGALRLDDRTLRGDLGNPDRVTWADRTRRLLDKGRGNANVVIWSWCGQVSNASPEDIDTYLSLMDRLERDYPNVTFIYMTGHLDGSGPVGNLNLRNDQIREFCWKNGKILYDFAGIESYDPEGDYVLDLGADDRCNYGFGRYRSNWAAEWCDSNPGQCEAYRCAHSHPLNCDLKARAFWWMMARLAGWAPRKALNE